MLEQEGRSLVKVSIKDSECLERGLQVLLSCSKLRSGVSLLLRGLIHIVSLFLERGVLGIKAVHKSGELVAAH